MCQEVDKKLCWYYHPDYTDVLDTSDAGVGNHMSGFGTMAMWSFGIWAYSLILISKYLSLTLWSSNGDKFVHILTLLIDISLRWGEVCPLLDNVNTRFFYRSYFLVIIFLYMILMKTILLFWYSPIHRVQIHRRLICQMIRWLILWDMIFWMQWNENMLGYVITVLNKKNLSK